MHYQTLAEIDGLGRVVMCNGCSDVHLAVNSLTLSIKKDAFIALSEMIQKALQHPKLSWDQANPQLFMATQLFSRA